ncbi:hypothetical protein HanIR_Chr15g0732701 [Helianthus annuus]|nr:hypothetical protein HanIR_Chr15g0732701 [Helianthus annuus]
MANTRDHLNFVRETRVPSRRTVFKPLQRHIRSIRQHSFIYISITAFTYHIISREISSSFFHIINGVSDQRRASSNRIQSRNRIHLTFSGTFPIQFP